MTIKMVLAALVLFCFGFATCSIRTKDTKKLDELHHLAEQTPKFQDFVQIDQYESSKSENAVVTFFYRSSAIYDEVKQFYIKNLISQGWTFSREENLSEWFMKTGNKRLTFARADYLIDLEYNSDKASDWQFALDYSWEKKP